MTLIILNLVFQMSKELSATRKLGASLVLAVINILKEKDLHLQKYDLHANLDKK